MKFVSGHVELDRNEEQALFESARDALDVLFLRSYWKRLWVVHEIKLAASLIVYYGSIEVDWGEF
jgi:hypothetical protein